MIFRSASLTDYPTSELAGGWAGSPMLADVVPIPMTEEGSRIDEFIRWVEVSGFAGAAALVGVFVLASMLMVPNTPLIVAAGWIWGLWQGVLVVGVATFVASTLGFWVGQKLIRPRLLNRYGDRPKFAAVDAAVGEEGAKVIFLLRLAPVFPYGISNYIYGVTGVRYVSYIVATMAGLVPVTLLYAYLGTVKRAGEESPEGIQRVALGLAFIALFGGFWYLGKICRKALRTAAANPGGGGDTTGAERG